MAALFTASIRRRQLWALRASLVIAWLLLPAYCLLPSVQAQALEPPDTIRIDTDLVNVSVSVFSRHAALPKRIAQAAKRSVTH